MIENFFFLLKKTIWSSKMVENQKSNKLNYLEQIKEAIVNIKQNTYEMNYIKWLIQLNIMLCEKNQQ